MRRPVSGPQPTALHRRVRLPFDMLLGAILFVVMNRRARNTT